MIKAFFFCITFISIINGHCQTFYIRLSGDSIKGSVINYKQWTKNPSEINFIDSNEKHTIVLTPSNCKGFQVENLDHYVSYKGARIANLDHIKDKISLDDNKNIIKDSIHVFLRVLYSYKGFTLYVLNDNKRINYYLGKNESIHELEYYEYVDDENHIQQYDPFRQFILQQFNVQLTENIKKRIENLSYNETDLIDFFAQVLQDKEHATERSRLIYPTRKYIGFGMNYNYVFLNDGGPTYYHQSNFSPFVEFGLRIYGQRNFGKAYFQPSIYFTLLNNSFTLTDNARYQVKGTIIGLHATIGYNFISNENATIYAAWGFGFDVTPDFQTLVNNSQTSYAFVAEQGVINKISLHPEFGFNLHKKINAGLIGTLPLKFPFYSDLIYSYQLTQIGFFIRYLF